MQLHGEHHRPRHTPSAHADVATLHATELAIKRAQDALALACGAARSKETLYSIARAVAWEMNCDVDEIEARLDEHFPDLAK